MEGGGWEERELAVISYEFESLRRKQSSKKELIGGNLSGSPAISGPSDFATRI